jgi:hypothetical protein
MPALRPSSTLWIVSVVSIVHAPAQGAERTAATELVPASEAAAQPANDAVVNERRSGFTFGLHVGPALGRAVGYPNEVHKIDRSAYRTSTGLSFGVAGTLWFGGALRDWFTFAVGGAATRLASRSPQLQDWAVFCRVEAFPVYAAGELWRDVSVYADFGAGSALVFGDESRRGEGGDMSHVGVGVAYEAWRTGHFVIGPTLGYYTLFSQSLESHIGFVALRTSFYGGP